MKRAIVVLLIVSAVGAGGGAYYLRRGSVEVTVNTAPISRGDVIDTVGATGTLQAVTTVQVGSQVSGNIAFLGADFNSIVHKGQVIARLDPSLIQAQVEQARANLLRARADLVRYRADVERTRVALTDAQQKFARARELNARNLLPQSDLDAAQIAVDSAQAQVQAGQAQLQSAQAQVEQAQASLNQNQVNAEHTVITAPIDGIVTSRNVDVGQTVAASLQSPTLFVIAADLTKMQVNANIDEADVGRIRPGQHVTFRVDAYPAEEFQGEVAQVRLQPVVVQNVTTYGTVINVPNQELKLKPGMTANVRVEVARRTDVVRVPNTGLRFRPNADMFAALNQPAPPELTSAGRGMDGPGNGAGGPQGTQHAPGAGRGFAGAPGARGAPQAPADAPMGAARQQGPTAGAMGGPGPGGAAPDGARGARGGDEADRRARMMERFKTMSAEERQQAIARMRARGMDVSGLEGAAPAKAAPKSASTVQTIDALFAPLPPAESTGRAWLFMNKQLKSVRLRLGVSDGTHTEVLSGELQPGMEVVTGIIGVAATRTSPTGTGNPLMPQRGGPRGR